MIHSINKTNTVLPEVVLAPMRPVKFLARKIWGAIFIILAFIFMVAFIYHLQVPAPIEQLQNQPGTLCIQVVTLAYNPATGESRDFPTPCDVPDGWVKSPESGLITPAPSME